MTISEIYIKLGIPPNLQQHMLRVTSVSLFIANNWKESEFNIEILKTMLLLHDIGNIVRFDFEKHPEFLGDEVKRVDFWKKCQKENIVKYGSGDHKATASMLNELGISEEIKQKIYQRLVSKGRAVFRPKSWSLRNTNPSGTVRRYSYPY